MQVTMTTPGYLLGQRAENVFDTFWLPRSTAPAGVLGSSLTTDISVLQQAVRLGFTPTSYTYG